MKTLDHWKSRFSAIPSTIECSEMRILTCRDHEPPVFVGPGQIGIKSSTTAEFKVFAQPPHGERAIEKIILAYANPYEIVDQFRLFATDYEGTEWACGWTVPRLENRSAAGALLSGWITSLAAHVTAPWVSTESGVELVFQPGFQLPMESQMLTVHSIGAEEIQRSWKMGKHTLKLLGSQIEFFLEPEEDALWVIANTSNDLPHPNLENWLSEPLRVLLGQLIFPRLVARNFGDGSAHVWVRPSPRAFQNASIASLIRSEIVPTPTRFWDLCAALLTLIAKGKNEQGLPNFETNRITRFYEEIVQASQGSRWVLCMTLASVAEGLARALMTPDDRTSDFTESEIQNLKDTIQSWQGSDELKARMFSSIAYLGDKSVGKFMTELGKRGVLESQHQIAWKTVRNKVMHGNLVSPWGTKEEDEHIIALGDLVHRLTRELIGANIQQKT